MLSSIGTAEWIVIALIIAFLFGGKKIPEFFRGLTEAVNEFKKASKEDNNA